MTDPISSYESSKPAQDYPLSIMSIISLTMGILGFTLLPFFGSIIAIVTGHLAKKEISDASGRMTGGAFATAGLILGYLAIVLTVLAICMLAGLIGLIILGAINASATIPLISLVL